MTAADQWICEGMRSCLPEGCPLPWTTIESASFLREHEAEAQVIMFDRVPATLSVSRHPISCIGWIISWKELPGGAIWWNGEAWARRPKK